MWLALNFDLAPSCSTPCLACLKWFQPTSAGLRVRLPTFVDFCLLLPPPILVCFTEVLAKMSLNQYLCFTL